MTDVPEPVLPWDILREIAFICPRRTCTTLMRTCPFFYHEAAVSILSHAIHLDNESTVAGFLNFLHAGKKPRYPCVRRLSLWYHHQSQSPLTPETANALAEGIALMTGLAVVDIRHGDRTIGSWPALGDAIASLPSLRRFFISEAGPRSRQLLLSLQSANLRSVKLGTIDHDSKRTPWLSSHPVQLCARWTSTLTEFEYHSPFLPALQHTPSCYPEVYPMMRTLSICYRGRVDPIPYIRAFPNLAHLGVEGQIQLNDEVHEYRTSNIRSQREVQRRGPASQHPGWRELDQFNGQLIDLYALALPCRISHIRLDNDTEDIHLPLLPAVLADARPLHLSMYGWEGVLHHPTDNLSSVLQTEGASRLESLVVSCLLDGCALHEDVASALASLAASLAMLPGPFRRLHVHIEIDDECSSVHRAESPPGLTVVAAHLSDIEKIVENFVETIPTLEDALVQYSLRDKNIGLREATFQRGGVGVMLIGGTSVTYDPLDCGMFQLR